MDSFDTCFVVRYRSDVLQTIQLPHIVIVVKVIDLKIWGFGLRPQLFFLLSFACRDMSLLSSFRLFEFGEADGLNLKMQICRADLTRVNLYLFNVLLTDISYMEFRKEGSFIEILRSILKVRRILATVFLLFTENKNDKKKKKYI